MTKKEFYENLAGNLKASGNYAIKRDGKELCITAANNYVRVNFYRNTVTVHNDSYHDVKKYYYTGNIVVLTMDQVEKILQG